MIQLCSFQNAGSVRELSDCTQCIRFVQVSSKGLVSSHPRESPSRVIHPWDSLDLASCQQDEATSDRNDIVRAQASNLSVRCFVISVCTCMACLSLRELANRLSSLPLLCMDDLFARTMSYWVEITALENDTKETIAATTESGSMLFVAAV
jgi:hypothetical protein